MRNGKAMGMWRALLALPLAGILALAPAHAQDDADGDLEGDLRCVALLAVAVANTQGEAQAGITAGLMYFVGRIDGVAPGIDLKAELQRIAATMTDPAADMTRCSAILTAKGQALIAIGGELSGTQ